ncbi:MAG: hypothetical protein QXS21_05725 [Thermoproteota archaeon]|nr:hypothetical protein [Candidatus Brockarchaeota archaeon]MBO3767743.1 hypothetical protein [Candidatus Brockarchaeota archaeon]MBO3800727.1 hypothetical protein [Candidatus Brockarchaeota archaeon]
MESERALVSLLVKKGINRVRAELLTKPVRVVPKSEVELSSTLFGDLQIKKSSSTEIPYFVATVMEQNGLLEMPNSDLSEKNLKMFSWNERYKETKLSSLPENFYLLAQEVLLNAKDKKSDSLIIEIVSLRIKKLLRYLVLPSVPPEVINSFSPEEKYLFYLLREVISSWQREVLGIGAR